MSKYALQFSGGVDSLACLWLLRDSIDLTVYWGKVDGVYPGMQEYIEKCCNAANLPLVVVEGDRRLAEFGYPKDNDSESVFECCRRGLWEPMHKKMIEDNITVVYRGQRDDDPIDSGVRSGYVDDRGVEYIFPIADWNRENVTNYLLRSCAALLPESYWAGEETGRDCWDCTGYLFQNKKRIFNLPEDKQMFVIKEIQNGRG